MILEENGKTTGMAVATDRAVALVAELAALRDAENRWRIAGSPP